MNLRTKFVNAQVSLTKSGCLYALQCVVSKRSRKNMMKSGVKAAALMSRGVHQVVQITGQRRAARKQIKADLSSL